MVDTQLAFKEFIHNTFIPFMKEHNLAHGTLRSNGGDKAVVKRDKHGFYEVTFTFKEGNL